MCNIFGERDSIPFMRQRKLSRAIFQLASAFANLYYLRDFVDEIEFLFAQRTGILLFTPFDYAVIAKRMTLDN